MVAPANKRVLLESDKAAANGLATLGADSKIPADQLNTGTADGLATLDGTAKIPDNQFPARLQATALADATAAAIAPKLDKTEAAATYRTLLKSASTKAADYTLSLADLGSVVEVSAATATRVTVPLAASVAFPVGTELDVARIGSGVVTVAPVYENLIANPSVETDLTTWVARTGALARTTDAALAPTGLWGVRATSTAAGQNFGWFHQVPGSFASLGIKVGDAISIRVNVRSNFANGGQVGVRFQSGPTMISQVFGATVVNGVAKLENAVIPAGCDNLLLLSQALSTASGQTVDWDGLVVCRGAVAPAIYVDGDQAGMAWLGTPHASRSQGPVVRQDTTTIPLNGRVTLRKRAANEWVVGNALPPEALRATDTLQGDRDNGQVGLVAPNTVMATTSAAALLTGRAYLARFVPSRAMAITKVAFRVQVASGTDDPCDVGIYDSAGTKIVSSGANLGKLNSTGTKTVTVASTALAAGVVYYVAFAATSAAQLMHASVIGDLFGAVSPALEVQKKDASYPLPATLTGLTGSDLCPVLAVRES